LTVNIIFPLIFLLGRDEIRKPGPIMQEMLFPVCTASPCRKIEVVGQETIREGLFFDVERLFSVTVEYDSLQEGSRLSLIQIAGVNSNTEYCFLAADAQSLIIPGTYPGTYIVRCYCLDTNKAGRGGIHAGMFSKYMLVCIENISLHVMFIHASMYEGNILACMEGTCQDVLRSRAARRSWITCPPQTCLRLTCFFSLNNHASRQIDL
jgi:hypothetical protein